MSVCSSVTSLRELAPMSFPQLNLLPQEIINHILYLATSPEHGVLDGSKNRSYYRTALVVCQVSHTFRQEAMRYLLRSVVLLCTTDVRRFCTTLHIQQRHKENNSPLALNYASLVRQLWCSRCEWEMSEKGGPNVDYSILYDVISGLECLGIQFHALPLLYNTLSLSSLPTSNSWACSKIVLCGGHWRWNPLTNVAEGLAFLSQVTHLQCWLFGLDDDDRFHDWQQQIGNRVIADPREAKLFRAVPVGLQRTPLDLFTSLSHFSSSFFDHDGFWASSLMNSLVTLSMKDPVPEALVRRIAGPHTPSWLPTTTSEWHALFVIQTHETAWRRAKGPPTVE